MNFKFLILIVVFFVMGFGFFLSVSAERTIPSWIKNTAL